MVRAKAHPWRKTISGLWDEQLWSSHAYNYNTKSEEKFFACWTFLALLAYYTRFAYKTTHERISCVRGGEWILDCDKLQGITRDGKVSYSEEEEEEGVTHKGLIDEAETLSSLLKRVQQEGV